MANFLKKKNDLSGNFSYENYTEETGLNVIKEFYMDIKEINEADPSVKEIIHSKFLEKKKLSPRTIELLMNS